MNRIELHLWVAALLQWLVASSNLFAARIFAYRQEVAKLSPFVREVFIVQNIYIMTTVAMFGIVSIVFTAELAGGSAPRPVSERFSGDLLGQPDHHPALLLRSRGQVQSADREPRVPGHVHLPLWRFRRGLPAAQSMKRRLDADGHSLARAARGRWPCSTDPGCRQPRHPALAQLTAFGSRRHRYLEVRSTYAFSMTPTDTIYGQFRRIGGGGASSPGP